MAAAANDAFANAELLRGTVGSLETFNALATSDGANDPLASLFHSNGTRTVWYKYYGYPGAMSVFTVTSEFGTGGSGGPPGSGSVRLTRPVIGFYRGSALGALTELAYNDGTGVTKKTYDNVTATAAIQLTLPAEEYYYIEVTGLNDSGVGGLNVTQGQFRLFWDGPDPPTDAIVNVARKVRI